MIQKRRGCCLSLDTSFMHIRPPAYPCGLTSDAANVEFIYHSCKKIAEKFYRVKEKDSDSIQTKSFVDANRKINYILFCVSGF